MFGWILRAPIYSNLWYLKVIKIIARKRWLFLNVIQRQYGPTYEEKQEVVIEGVSPVLGCPSSGTRWDCTVFLLLLLPCVLWSEGGRWHNGKCLDFWNIIIIWSKSGSFSYCCHLMISFSTENKSMKIIKNILYSHVCYPSEDLIYSTLSIRS